MYMYARARACACRESTSDGVMKEEARENYYCGGTGGVPSHEIAEERGVHRDASLRAWTCWQMLNLL